MELLYHHEVQSLLYTLQRGGDGEGAQYHNEGFHNKGFHDEGLGTRQYKLFTFSTLRGRNMIANKRIIFNEVIYLDVRSVRGCLCDQLELALKENPAVELCGQALTVKSIKTTELIITEDKLNIRMLSPLEVHTTGESKYSYYFTPLDKDFNEHINANFQRKWAAYTGNRPVSDITLTAVNVGARDKYVTTYKSTHINAWRGEYLLTGNPEYLNFLYYCGLGARNASGFGMFEVI